MAHNKVINPDLDGINEAIAPKKYRSNKGAFLNASGAVAGGATPIGSTGSIVAGGGGSTTATTTKSVYKAGGGAAAATGAVTTNANLGSVATTGATTTTTGALTGKTTTPPTYPASGTLLSQACVGMNMVGTYANGAGGTYTNIITTNSTACGYVAPPASGTLISSACVGMNTVGTYANGSGGTYTAIITTNDPKCGYVAPPVNPAYGTLISSACSGYNTVGTYADGKGGTYTAVITTNDPACGYVAAFTTTGVTALPPIEPTPLPGASPAGPAQGTLINTYCNGPDQWGTYADGVGGTYTSIIQAGSASCASGTTTATTTPATTSNTGINWPIVLGVIGLFGGVYFFMGRKKAA